MALNRQIWLNTIIENFFPDNSFASKSVDDSGFVTHHTVHVPNAGAPSSVAVNRNHSSAAAVSQRTDYDLNYDIDELTTDPIYIPDIDKVELSYDKRQSILFNDRTQLQDAAMQNLLYRWFVSDNAVVTTGASTDPHTSTTATGSRKKITKADVLALMVKFNRDNVPAEGRYLLLDAVMYADLLADLTGTELSAFLASADAQRGTLGKLYGFEIMQRSQVLRVNTSGALIKWTANAAATERAAGLAWQQQCVSRALGEVKMFDNLNDPTYYGDIYSFLMRTGGLYRRYDKKGVCALIEDTAA